MKINKKRIKELVKRKSLKQKEIAVQIGVTPQDWNNWMFRGVFPHYNKLEDLAKILTVDVSELLADESIQEPAISYNGKKRTFSTEDLIPFYEVDTQTNLTTFWKDQSDTIPKDYVYLPGLKADFVFPYFGKGLEPQLVNGDWIALRRVRDTSFFNYGSLYTIVTREQVMTRYIKSTDGKDSILLFSTDNFHDDFVLPVKSIKALFLIVSIIKREVI